MVSRATTSGRVAADSLAGECARGRPSPPCPPVLTASVHQRLCQFVDHIGAEAVHANIAQAAGVVGCVHGPDDHAPACGVDALDQPPIDHVTMGPEIAGKRRIEGVWRVNQICIGQNADWRLWRQLAKASGNPVVERVYGSTPRRVARQAIRHHALDTTGFHLDIYRRGGACRIEDGIQRWHPLTRRSNRCFRERCPVHSGDCGACQPARCCGQHRIVVYDDDPINRRMDVKLPTSGTGRAGGEEPGKGVLAVPARHAAMGDHLGKRASVRHGRDGEIVEKENSGVSDLNIAGSAASAYQTDMPEVIRAGDDAEIDRALIVRWNAGDERAASALVARHATSLARFVSSLGVQVAPEEIVQDTFVRAFGSLDSFRGDSSMRSWLFTIARRLVLDQRRAGRRERNHVTIEDAQDQLVSADDVLDGVVADESERRVREAVARLSPLQREVFTLRVVEGLSYKEIAVVASTSEGAARVHYHNAMKAVKEFLDA